MNYYNYIELKEKFSERFLMYLPEPFRSGQVRITNVNKTNQTREALNIYSKKIQGSPLLYMDDVYRKYMETGDLYATLDFFASYYMEAVSYMDKNINKFSGFDVSDNIIYQLINYERNRELLKNVPYRRFHDLAIIYRLAIVTEEESDLYSAVITNDYLKAKGCTEEDLFLIASANTLDVFPPIAKRVGECFYAVTNKYMTFGATTMLYPEVLSDIADVLESDLYILPSSIHELFIMAKDNQDICEMLEIIKDANENICKPEEILSDRPYCYYRRDEIIDML